MAEGPTWTRSYPFHCLFAFLVAHGVCALQVLLQRLKVLSLIWHIFTRSIVELIEVLELLDYWHDLKELMRIEKLVDDRTIVVWVVQQKEECVRDLT